MATDDFNEELTENDWDDDEGEWETVQVDPPNEDAQRLVRLYIDPQFLVMLLNGLDKYDCIMLHKDPLGIPKDAVVVNCYHQPSCRGWFAVIHSMEFDVVPDGDEIPLLDHRMATVTWKRKSLKETHEPS